MLNKTTFLLSILFVGVLITYISNSVTETHYEKTVIVAPKTVHDINNMQTEVISTTASSSEIAKSNSVSTTTKNFISTTTKPVINKSQNTSPVKTEPKNILENKAVISNNGIASNVVSKNPPQTLTKKLSWGVYAGAHPEAINDFEKRIDVNPDYLAYFIHWGNDNGKLPTWLRDYAYAKDRTLVIFWEASDYLIGGTNQPEFSYQTILNGEHDKYLSSFAEQTKNYKGPIILIPFSELNGNWTPWSGTMNGNTPEKAVLAFRYVHDFFDNVPNVKFGLAVNAASVPDTYENRIEAYYPGDEYVDYVGVDGFNMGNPAESFSYIFNSPLNILGKYGKPIFIFSFGTAAGEEKATWLDDALSVQMPKYPLLKGFIYFNENKERNWLLWSDKDTFEVFENYISKE
jgi:beta-mannanase